jgi:hypothetical protein
MLPDSRTDRFSKLEEKLLGGGIRYPKAQVGLDEANGGIRLQAKVSEFVDSFFPARQDPAQG